MKLSSHILREENYYNVFKTLYILLFVGPLIIKRTNKYFVPGAPTLNNLDNALFEVVSSTSMKEQLLESVHKAGKFICYFLVHVMRSKHTLLDMESSSFLSSALHMIHNIFTVCRLGTRHLNLLLPDILTNRKIL